MLTIKLEQEDADNYIAARINAFALQLYRNHMSITGRTPIRPEKFIEIQAEYVTAEQELSDIGKSIMEKYCKEHVDSEYKISALEPILYVNA
jgi:hypothetical protein